jgi:serine/threonine protein kinase/Tol biopolymer transport system component
MPVAPGTQLGPYDILAPIGAGGMGEVFRARDTRLNRLVAIKILHENFSERVEYEARAIAALNHPHICQIYDVGPNYLVMEYIEGESPKGPMPLEAALRIARQIADALDAAHQKNIIHRDLKPGNIKIKPDGTVKVLDFGLAKMGISNSPGADPASSPTLTIGMTEGMIVGTAAYMSPEQARGKTVDRRADIWAFGVVLYELITGKRLFTGEDVSEVLAGVIKDQPNLDAAPPQVRRLLESCLEKDPVHRLRDIGDAWKLLDEPDAETAPLRRSIWLPWIAAGIFAIAAAAIAWMARTSQPSARALPTVALSIVPPGGTELPVPGGIILEKISPDGTAVLFRTSDNRLHIRRLDSLQSERVPPFDFGGTPFWTPDSQYVALSTLKGLFKMHLPGGALQLVTRDLTAERGGTWGDDGTILCAKFDSSPGSVGLYVVSAGGGHALPVEVQGLKDGRYYNPEFLPGRRDFLFAFSPNGTDGTQIYLATLRDRKAVDAKFLFNNDTSVTFTPAGGGRIVFVRDDNLYSQKLDLGARKLLGEPQLVQEHIVSDPGVRNAVFSVSASGTLVWRSGTAIVSQLFVFDRNGNRTGVAGAPAPIGTVSLSPDEAHFLARGEAGAWIMETNGSGRVNAGNGAITLTIWSPDGSRVVQPQGTKVVEVSLDGSRVLRELGETPASARRRILVHGISPDSRRIVYSDEFGLYLLSLPENQATELVGQRVDNAAISADGTWVVYHPYTEPGIYVQPLSGKGLRKQIASSGNFPVWRADGKEILYYDPGHIWSVGIQGSGEELRFSAAEQLFSVARPMGLLGGSRPLAVNRDGSRIYFLQSTEQPDAGVIQVRTGAIQ